MRKLLVLQFDDNTTMQNAIVEHKVGVIILVIDNDALLASLKTKAFAQFEDKLLQVSDKRILQILFIYNLLCFQSEKLKGEWLAYLQRSRVVSLHRGQGKHFLWVVTNTSTEI